MTAVAETAQIPSVRSVLRSGAPRFAREAFGPVGAFYVGWKVGNLATGIALATVLAIALEVYEHRRGRRGTLALVSAGFVVVQKAAGDGGVHGRPIVTLVVQGFVLGRVSPRGQGRVDIYQLPSATDKGTPQAVGDVLRSPVRWRGHKGIEYSGSGFRFRAIDGAYRIVVRGAGVYLFAGGNGSVLLRGSSVYKQSDGKYSVDGETPNSMPTIPLARAIGRG